MFRRTKFLASVAISSCLMSATACGQETSPNTDVPVATEEFSKWGEGDQIGSANYLSDDKALLASKLVKQGKVYSLGIPVGAGTPAVSPRRLDIHISMPGQYQGTVLGNNKASYLDDVIIGSLGIGTQIDSFAHAGSDGVFYNGNHASDFVTPRGVTKLGVEGIPPIVTRGILIDIAKFKGVDYLKEGEIITELVIKAAAMSQNIEIREGDVVLLHTGWLRLIESDPDRFKNGEPGLNRASAEYLASKNIVAVGMDNWGIDAVPFSTNDVFDAHVTLLKEHGTYILEVIDTRELVKDNVQEFMFVLGQPRFKGAIQTVINPIAIR